MNFPKINMILLIVVIAGIAVVLYFLFVNKKDTNAQSELMMQMAKNMGAQNPKAQNLNTKSENPADDEPPVPTDEDWKNIYAISEKIYFKKPLTIHEKKIQKDFDSYIQADIVEFCEQFYPLVDKLAFPEKYNPLERVLNAEENEFYEANKEQVDAQVEHSKLKVEKLESVKVKEPDNSDLTKANPPVNIEERNQKILSLFEDGIPKSIPQIKPLYMKATGTDPGKNLYRIFGKLEGKFLTPYKDGNITYYCLPEWFEGRKLKTEFKNKIV